jgi:hypothetical protein
LKNAAKLFCLGILTSFCGCLPGMGEWDITLYEQKIEGTSKAIYKYDAWGGRDSNVNGYAILDTTETFTIQRISKLPITQLNGIPNKNLINAIGTESSKETSDFNPIATEKIKSEGINIEIKNYKSNSFRKKSQGLWRYDFAKFEETRDSLFFYDLDDNISMQKSHIDSLRIRKGNVIIRQKENKEIIQIVVKHLILSNDGKDSIESNKPYFLKPKTHTKSDQFSDYGIFKEKSTVPNTVYN